MKKTFILLSILLLSVCLAISGCNSIKSKSTVVEPKIGSDDQPTQDVTPNTKPTTVTPEEPTKPSDTVMQDIEVPVETVMPKISSEIESTIANELSPPNKFVVRPYTLDAKIGDTVVYGVGIYNAYSQPTAFKLIDAQFLDATDYMNNRITLQQDTMDKWVLTGNVRDVELEPYSYTIVPVYIKIQKKVTEIQSTSPGTYRFNIQVYKYTDKEHTSKTAYADKDFFLRVK